MLDDDSAFGSIKQMLRERMLRINIRRGTLLKKIVHAARGKSIFS